MVRQAALFVTATAVLHALACDRGDAPSAPTGARAEQELVKPPPTPPEYSFEPGLREHHREVCNFVQQFLEVCLAGDYSGYRRLVSRTRDPESKERFQAIYHAMRSVRVESIDPIELRTIKTEAYRVVSAVELDPNAKVALRGSQRKVAMLIFREDDEWRMLPAPASLQPGEAPEDETETPASGPSFPWDEDGDY